MKDVNEDNLSCLLKIENLSKTGQLVYNRVREHANIYHNDKNYRQIVDDILEEQTKALE